MRPSLRNLALTLCCSILFSEVVGQPKGFEYDPKEYIASANCVNGGATGEFLIMGDHAKFRIDMRSAKEVTQYTFTFIVNECEVKVAATKLVSRIDGGFPTLGDSVLITGSSIDVDYKNGKYVLGNTLVFTPNSKCIPFDDNDKNFQNGWRRVKIGFRSHTTASELTVKILQVQPYSEEEANAKRLATQPGWVRYCYAANSYGFYSLIMVAVLIYTTPLLVAFLYQLLFKLRANRRKLEHCDVLGSSKRYIGPGDVVVYHSGKHDVSYLAISGTTRHTCGVFNAIEQGHEKARNQSILYSQDDDQAPSALEKFHNLLHYAASYKAIQFPMPICSITNSTAKHPAREAYFQDLPDNNLKIVLLKPVGIKLDTYLSMYAHGEVVEDAISVLGGILAAILYMHQADYVHRCLRLSSFNVINIKGELFVKLIDPGFLIKTTEANYGDCYRRCFNESTENWCYASLDAHNKSVPIANGDFESFLYIACDIVTARRLPWHGRPDYKQLVPMKAKFLAEEKYFCDLLKKFNVPVDQLTALNKIRKTIDSRPVSGRVLADMVSDIFSTLLPQTPKIQFPKLVQTKMSEQQPPTASIQQSTPAEQSNT